MHLAANPGLRSLRSLTLGYPLAAPLGLWNGQHLHQHLSLFCALHPPFGNSAFVILFFFLLKPRQTSSPVHSTSVAMRMSQWGMK